MPDSPKLLIPPFGHIYALFAPITELLIRLIAGGALAYHGYEILFGNIEGAARFFESVGFDNGLLWAWWSASSNSSVGFALRSACSRASRPGRSSFFSSSQSSPITGKTASTGKRAASSILCSGRLLCFTS